MLYALQIELRKLMHSFLCIGCFVDITASGTSKTAAGAYISIFNVDRSRLTGFEVGRREAAAAPLKQRPEPSDHRNDINRTLVH